MFTRAIKLIIGGCSLLFISTVVLSIVLPLTLIKNDTHLIVAVIPGLNDGTIKALKTLDDPTYNKFFDENVITSLNDDAKNLKHFTTARDMDSNYLKMILDKGNYVMLSTEGDYNNRVPIDILGRHETIDFPKIAPSIFISGGLEKMEDDVRSLYDDTYEYQYLDLKDIFTQKIHSLGAIMDSDTFGYKIDYPEKYDPMVKYFSQEKVNVFENKGISIFDFTKSEDALRFKDSISYLVETQFILDLFLKNKAFEKKNILFLPSLPKSQHIHVTDYFNMDMIKNVQHSFNRLLEQYRILSCSELENIFDVEMLKNCEEGKVLTVDYLYELVEKNFGIHIVDDRDDLKVFGQGKKLSKLESSVQTFKSLGQEISRIFKYQSDEGEEEIPDEDTKVIVNFDTDTHQSLSNPCQLSASLENVSIGVTSEVGNFALVDLYCQTDDSKETIALFDLSFLRTIDVNLSTCDHIFLSVRGDDEHQDSIVIPKAKDIKFTDNIQLGTIINFEIGDQCKDAFIVSRCASDSFDHSCETIDFPYIYTDISNEYIHFEVVDRNNHLFYEQITLPVLPLETISSDINVYASGFENYVILEGITISPSNKDNDWEISVKLEYEDDQMVDTILQYNSNNKKYILVLDEDDYFKEGTYKFEIEEHVYGFEILTHIDFGASIQSFSSNKCHVEDTVIKMDIVVDEFVNDDVLLICDDDGELIQTWKEGEYDLTKDVNISDCENIYLNVRRQYLDYQTSRINIKTTAIEVPDEVFLDTIITFDIDVEECKDSFLFYACENNECIELTTFPHTNKYLNANGEEYYSIVGVSNGYEYLTLVPMETVLQMEPTTHVGSLTTNVQLDTLSIVPTDPNNTEGYDVKVDHIIDDIVIEIMEGTLISLDTESFDTEDVSKGYGLVLKDKNFENGKYVIAIGNVNVTFDVELLASFDKNTKSSMRNICFTPSNTFEYIVNFHEDIDADVYFICQKDGSYNNIGKVEIPFEETRTVTDCDSIFLTPDPDAENLIKYDEIITRSSNLIIEPVIEERLLGNPVTLNIEDSSCSSEYFVLERCVIDGECETVDFKLDESNIFSITHPLKHFQYTLKSQDVEHVNFNFIPVTTITLDNNQVSLIDDGNAILLDNFIIEPASLENQWELEIKIEFGDTILDAILKHNIVDEVSIFKVNLKDDKLFEFGEYVLLFEHDNDYKTTKISVIVDLEFDESTKSFLSNECHIVDILDNVPMNIYNNIDNGYLVCLNNEQIIYTSLITKNTLTTFDLTPCNNIYLSGTDINGNIRKSETIIVEKTSLDIPLYDDHIRLFGSTTKYVEGVSQLCIDNLVLAEYIVPNSGELIPYNFEINTGYLESNGDDFMFVVKGLKNDFEYKKVYYKSEKIQYIHVDGIHNVAGDEHISPFNLIINAPLQELYWITPLHISRNDEKREVLLTYDENGYTLETIGDYGFEVGSNSLIFPGNREIPFIINTHSNTYNLVICILDGDQKTCQRDFDNILEPSTYYIELENNILLPSDYTIKIYSIVEDDDNEFLQHVEQNDQLELLPGSYYICVYDNTESVFGNSCISIDILASPAQFSEFTLDAIPDTCMIDADEFYVPVCIEDIFKRNVSIVCTDDLDNILREEIYDDYDDTEKMVNIGHCVKLLVLLQGETDVERYQDIVQIKQFYLDYDNDETTMYFSRVFDVKLINTCEPETPSKLFINGIETNYFQIRSFNAISIDILATVGEHLIISKTYSALRISSISYDTQRFRHVCRNGFVITGSDFKVNQGGNSLYLLDSIYNIEGTCHREGFVTYSARLSIKPDGSFTIQRSSASMTTTFQFDSTSPGTNIRFNVDVIPSDEYCRVY